MDVLWKNIVYSVRMLLKRPGLTIVAIVAIGLGIGANTAIFSVVNTVLLQPLPYPQPKQLVMLSTEQRNQTLDGRGSFSVPDFLDVQQSSTSLEYVATVQGAGTIITEGGDPERVLGAAVSADYFSGVGCEAGTWSCLHARRRQTRSGFGNPSQSWFVATTFWWRSGHYRS